MFGSGRSQTSISSACEDMKLMPLLPARKPEIGKQLLPPHRHEAYSGLVAVCGVKFVPISGFRRGDRGIDFMSSHADEIEVWLVPLPNTTLYVPYRISVPTAFGSGSAEMLSFQVKP